MKIINLPYDLFPAQKGKRENINFHAYTASFDSFKGKSILHTNAISLVAEGEKTMHFANKTVYAKDNEIHFLSAGNCIASVNFSRKKTFRSILVFFDNNALTDFYVKYARLVRDSKKNAETSSQPYVSFRKDAFITSISFIRWSCFCNRDKLYRPR